MKQETEKPAPAPSQSIPSPAVNEKTVERNSASINNYSHIYESEKPESKFLTKQTLFIIGIFICLIISGAVLKNVFFSDFKMECTTLIEYRGEDSEVVIPDKVTVIGDSAFYGCKSLTSITIPESVTSIGDYSFYKCSSLTSINIPDSVTSGGAFKAKCGALSLACRLGRCFCFAEVSTGDPHPHTLQGLSALDLTKGL